MVQIKNVIEQFAIHKKKLQQNRIIRANTYQTVQKFRKKNTNSFNKFIVSEFARNYKTYILNTFGVILNQVSFKKTHNLLNHYINNL